MKKSEILRVTKLCLAQMPGGADHAAAAVHDERDLHSVEICSLWSGMGHIYKVVVPSPSASNNASPQYELVIKHVAPPRSSSSLGDRRKADSYQVECNFYENVAPVLLAQHGLLLPKPYLVERYCGKNKNEMVIAMSLIRERSSSSSLYSSNTENMMMKSVLTWLATLHAAFWGRAADEMVQQAGLQSQGSYWYLDTRPDEHESMPNHGWEGRLKLAARAVDERLQRDPLQCIIHGDAKEANILVVVDGGTTEEERPVVAMCDFQYCGKGPPTKDLAYFFCSSVSPDDEKAALEFYLQELTKRLPDDVTPPTMSELEDSLELAYCDFYRFMSGWGYWGSGGEGRVKAVLQRLDGGKNLGSEEAYDDAVRREYG